MRIKNTKTGLYYNHNELYSDNENDRWVSKEKSSKFTSTESLPWLIKYENEFSEKYIFENEVKYYPGDGSEPTAVVVD